eukprot:2585590-Rhodomonas_salina.1
MSSASVQNCRCSPSPWYRKTRDQYTKSLCWNIVDFTWTVLCGSVWVPSPSAHENTDFLPAVAQVSLQIAQFFILCLRPFLLIIRFRTAVGVLCLLFSIRDPFPTPPAGLFGSTRRHPFFYLDPAVPEFAVKGHQLYIFRCAPFVRWREDRRFLLHRRGRVGTVGAGLRPNKTVAAGFSRSVCTHLFADLLPCQV